MKQQTVHILEKIMIQAACVLGAAAIYFCTWPLLRTWDPQSPITFLPEGNYLGLLAFVLLVAGLAGLGSVVTLPARPEGTLLAVLAAAGGASLRSSQLVPLLWRHDDGLRGLYVELALETLVLGVVLVLVIWLVSVLRAWLTRLKPKWAWRDPVADLTPAERKRAADLLEDYDFSQEFGALVRWGALPALLSRLGRLGASRTARKSKESARQYLVFLGLAMAISMVLLLLLLRSADRGQVLFALVFSFAMGVGIAHLVLPFPGPLACCLLPLLAGLAMYALAAVAIGAAGGALAWKQVPLYARALPIDWLTAGGFGAILGYWVSARFQEARILERAREEEPAQAN